MQVTASACIGLKYRCVKCLVLRANVCRALCAHELARSIGSIRNAMQYLMTPCAPHAAQTAMPIQPPTAWQARWQSSCQVRQRYSCVNNASGSNKEGASKEPVAQRSATRSSTLQLKLKQPDAEPRLQFGARGRAVSSVPPFRFWHDEKRFKGTGEDSLVQQELLRIGGERVGGHVKHAASVGPMGWQRMAVWDMLWSPSQTALKAAGERLRPGQVISMVPGTFAVSKKKALPQTLATVLGQQLAQQCVPQTFSLPADLPQWFEAGKRADQEELWILKTAQHLGKGIKVLPFRKAVAEVWARVQATEKQGHKAAPPYVAAQRYIQNPLLLDGKKFGVRLWALVAGHDPFRVYIHKNGLVLFSSDEYDTGTSANVDGSPAPGHLTNYAMNKHSAVWSLQQLRDAIGEDKFQQMYKGILKTTASVYAAALPAIRAECKRLRVPRDGAFEVMGLDFLIDDHYRPWLLETNATPSLAVEHDDSAVQELIHAQKMGMVKDMVYLLNLPARVKKGRPLSGKSSTATSSSSSSSSSSNSSVHSVSILGSVDARLVRQRMQQAFPQACEDPTLLEALVAAEVEMSRRGGFMPLMQAMPLGLDTIPWSEGDRLLQAWCKASKARAPVGSAGGVVKKAGDAPQHAAVASVLPGS